MESGHKAKFDWDFIQSDMDMPRRVGGSKPGRPLSVYGVTAALPHLLKYF